MNKKRYGTRHPELVEGFHVYKDDNILEAHFDRLNVTTYINYYGIEHCHPELVEGFVFIRMVLY